MAKVTQEPFARDRPEGTPMVGKHSKPNVWDAMQRAVYAGKTRLDLGAVFFVAALNHLGARTLFSCEGHPDGFYLVFSWPYDRALAVKRAGFFSVEIAGTECWSLELSDPVTCGQHVDRLRWAAEAWTKAFGLTETGLVYALEKAGFGMGRPRQDKDGNSTAPWPTPSIISLLEKP